MFWHSHLSSTIGSAGGSAVLLTEMMGVTLEPCLPHHDQPVSLWCIGPTVETVSRYCSLVSFKLMAWIIRFLLDQSRQWVPTVLTLLQVDGWNHPVHCSCLDGPNSPGFTALPRWPGPDRTRQVQCTSGSHPALRLPSQWQASHPLEEDVGTPVKTGIVNNTPETCRALLYITALSLFLSYLYPTFELY